MEGNTCTGVGLGGGGFLLSLALTMMRTVMKVPYAVP